MGLSSKTPMQLRLSAICLLLAVSAGTISVGGAVVPPPSKVAVMLATLTVAMSPRTLVSATAVTITSSTTAVPAPKATSTTSVPTPKAASSTSVPLPKAASTTSVPAPRAASTTSVPASKATTTSSMPASKATPTTSVPASKATTTTQVVNPSKIAPSPSQSSLAQLSTSVAIGWSKWNVTCKEGGCCDENVAFNKNYTQRRTCLPAGSSCPSDAYGKNLTRSISCPKKTSDCDGCKSAAANIQALAGLVSTMLVMALVLWI